MEFIKVNLCKNKVKKRKTIKLRVYTHSITNNHNFEEVIKRCFRGEQFRVSSDLITRVCVTTCLLFSHMRYFSFFLLEFGSFSRQFVFISHFEWNHTTFFS